MAKIYIPTVRDNMAGYNYLFGLWSHLQLLEEDVEFDFSKSIELDQNAVAFIGGIVRSIQSKHHKVHFHWRTLPGRIMACFAQNKFLETFGGSRIPLPPGHLIPYKEEIEQDKDRQIEYLKQEWLGRGWINISPALQAAIVGRVWELYANAFEHGKSPVGAFICGQHSIRSDPAQLKLTLVDFGKGIAANIREHFKRDDVRADAALRWAFGRGHTTVGKEMGRGLGLDLLREFVKLNSGRLEIFSHNAYVNITRKKEAYSLRPYSFKGTLVNITFMCDELYYKFSNEPDTAPIF